MASDDLKNLKNFLINQFGGQTVSESLKKIDQNKKYGDQDGTLTKYEFGKAIHDMWKTIQLNKWNGEHTTEEDLLDALWAKMDTNQSSHTIAGTNKKEYNALSRQELDAIDKATKTQSVTQGFDINALIAAFKAKVGNKYDEEFGNVTGYTNILNKSIENFCYDYTFKSYPKITDEDMNAFDEYFRAQMQRQIEYLEELENTYTINAPAIKTEAVAGYIRDEGTFTITNKNGNKIQDASIKSYSGLPNGVVLEQTNYNVYEISGSANAGNYSLNLVFERNGKEIGTVTVSVVVNKKEASTPQYTIDTPPVTMYAGEKGYGTFAIYDENGDIVDQDIANEVKIECSNMSCKITKAGSTGYYLSGLSQTGQYQITLTFKLDNVVIGTNTVSVSVTSKKNQNAVENLSNQDLVRKTGNANFDYYIHTPSWPNGRPSLPNDYKDWGFEVYYDNNAQFMVGRYWADKQTTGTLSKVVEDSRREFTFIFDGIVNILGQSGFDLATLNKICYTNSDNILTTYFDQKIKNGVVTNNGNSVDFSFDFKDLVDTIINAYKKTSAGKEELGKYNENNCNYLRKQYKEKYRTAHACFGGDSAKADAAIPKPDWTRVDSAYWKDQIAKLESIIIAHQSHGGGGGGGGGDYGNHY